MLQVQDYSCIYTSRSAHTHTRTRTHARQPARHALFLSCRVVCVHCSVSNLGLVSPERGFRTVRETMPHDATLDMDEM